MNILNVYVLFTMTKSRRYTFSQVETPLTLHYNCQLIYCECSLVGAPHWYAAFRPIRTETAKIRLIRYRLAFTSEVAARLYYGTLLLSDRAWLSPQGSELGFIMKHILPMVESCSHLWGQTETNTQDWRELSPYINNCSIKFEVFFSSFVTFRSEFCCTSSSSLPPPLFREVLESVTVLEIWPKNLISVNTSIFVNPRVLSTSNR
jgi:hypothetical protein